MRSTTRFCLGIVSIGVGIGSLQCTSSAKRDASNRSSDAAPIRALGSTLLAKSNAHPPQKTPRASNELAQYALEHPDDQWTLPPTLREISDVAVLSETTLACVQDERGSVFVYDLKQRRISAESRFGPKGDYEGLAATDTALYVLRSDGRLFELSSLKSHPEVRTFDLQIPARETEALCFDPGNARLLIAPKSDTDGDSKQVRSIYAFDLTQKALAPAPLIQISLRDIQRFAKEQHLPLPRRPRQNSKELHTSLHFKPSAIAVHPRSHDLYLLSAVDHTLVTCDRTGRITGYALLDAQLFRQPEGLAFFSNGDLLISSEAAGKEPKLLFFRSQRNSP